MVSAYEVIEKVAKTGKLKRGINEVTKAIERGEAKLVVAAKDVNPKEIVQHLEPLCKEKGIKLVWVDEKKKLGIAAGLQVAASTVAVIDAGEAAKDIELLK